MSKLNCLYNAEKILCYQMHQKWGGDNLSKVCPSIQWSLHTHTPRVRLSHFTTFSESVTRLGIFLTFLGVKLTFKSSPKYLATFGLILIHITF